MDPLSIASAAIGLSITCFEIASAIHKYVGEVKQVESTVALLGQDMSTLSTALGSVNNALVKNESSLNSKLGDESNLLHSLHDCIKDCGSTVKQIATILTEGQTHGRVGQAMGRIATHKKLKEKKKDLNLLRENAISFCSALNLNLQMIHMCLSIRAQECNKANQDTVLDGIGQLRQHVKQLTELSHSQSSDMGSLPASVRQSMGVATAMDESASTTFGGTQSVALSATPQGPSRKVHDQRIQNNHYQGSSSSNTGVKGGRPKPNPIQSQQPSPNNIHTRPTEGRSMGYKENEHMNDLKSARDLLSGGRTELAKSLCRKVIRETEFKLGVNHPSHKEAIEILAHIYEYTDDKEEASQLRLLLDTSGRNIVRQQIKTLVDSQNMEKCKKYVLRWALLLSDNARLQTYKGHLEGFATSQGYHKSMLFAAVSMIGNSLLAQSLLTQGVSIYSQVRCSWPGYKTITPLGCAIIFGHRYLVQTFLQSSSNDLDFIVHANCLEDAARYRDIEILRMLFDHIVLLQRGMHVAHMGSGRASQATRSEKLNVGVLLSQRVQGHQGSQGNPHPLREALHDSVDRHDLAMTKLLSDYGISDTTIIKAATKARWVEGIQALATDRNGVAEDDISYALGQDLSIAKYLLSLNPSLATNCISHAMSGSGVEGLKLVLRMGANVNAPTQYPLHLAVRSKSSQMVQTLLSAGADVHRKDGEGQTALHYAIKIGKNSHDDKVVFQAMLDIISLLRKSGATASSSGGSSLGWGMSSKSRQLSAALRV